MSSAINTSPIAIENLLIPLGGAVCSARFIFEWEDHHVAITAELKTADTIYSVVGGARQEHADELDQTIAMLAGSIENDIALLKSLS